MADLGKRTFLETFGTTSPVTGSAPSALTEGASLVGNAALSLVIVCPAAQTFSGAGTMECYVLDSEIGVWARAPGGDFDVDTASVRALSFDPVDVVTGRAGRVKWVPNAVTFSGGATGIDAYILGQEADGRFQP